VKADMAHTPSHDKCDSEPVVEEGHAEKTLDEGIPSSQWLAYISNTVPEEHTEPKAADPGAGSCCMRPDSRKWASFTISESGRLTVNRN